MCLSIFTTSNHTSFILTLLYIYLMREPSDTRILVACEFSGVVRDAFLDRGFNAISCDLLPCESTKYTDPSLHYQGDVCDILNDDYDLLIGHPPCTFMTNAGVRWLYNKDKSRNEPRWQSLHEAAKFFLTLYNANIPHVCIENPIMHKHAKALMDTLPKNQTNKCHYMAPSADRWKLRSITYSGIACAIADQYGDYILND